MKRPRPASAEASFVAHDAADRTVVRRLQGLSAHSDLVEVLWQAARALPGAALHAPDTAADHYGCVIAHAGGRVFAFAEGMQSIAMRLAADDGAAARAEGAEPMKGLDGWWRLRVYGGDRPAPAGRCAHWVARAHAAACARDATGP